MPGITVGFVLAPATIIQEVVVVVVRVVEAGWGQGVIVLVVVKGGWVGRA